MKDDKYMNSKQSAAALRERETLDRRVEAVIEALRAEHDGFGRLVLDRDATRDAIRKALSNV